MTKKEMDVTPASHNLCLRNPQLSWQSSTVPGNPDKHGRSLGLCSPVKIIITNVPSWSQWLKWLKMNFMETWNYPWMSCSEEGGGWKLACSSFQQFLSRRLEVPRGKQPHRGQYSGWGSRRWSACPRGHSSSAFAPGRRAGSTGSSGGSAGLARSLGLHFGQISGPESGCRKVLSSVIF